MLEEEEARRREAPAKRHFSMSNLEKREEEGKRLDASVSYISMR